MKKVRQVWDWQWTEAVRRRPAVSTTTPGQSSWLRTWRSETCECGSFHAADAVCWLKYRSPLGSRPHQWLIPLCFTSFPYQPSPWRRDSEWSLPSFQWILRNHWTVGMPHYSNSYNFLGSVDTDFQCNANKIFSVALAFIALNSWAICIPWRDSEWFVH